MEGPGVEIAEETRLLERETEQRLVERFLTTVNAGDGRVLLIEGAPGIGKTSLLAEAVRLAASEGYTVFRARGAELEHEFAYGAARQLFWPLRFDHSAIDEDAQSAALLFASNRSPSAAETTVTFPLFLSLYWWAVRLADSRPLLMAVDDAQWLDEPSLRFLGFLSRRLDGVRIGLLVASRPPVDPDQWQLVQELSADPQAIRLTPRPLGEVAVRELLSTAFDEPADETFAATCARTTGGNPLYVRELIRRLRTEDIHPAAAAAPEAERLGPLAVSLHVQGRLGRQPRPVRRLAEAAAVLGPEASAAVVRELAGLGQTEFDEARERLIRLGVLQGGTDLSYAHPLLAAAVYEGLTVSSRDRAHTDAAELLNRMGATPERQASHLLKTTPTGDRARVQVLLAAATEARRRGAPESAARYLERALNEPPPVDLRSEIARQLGNSEAYAGRFTAADRHLREAVAVARTPAARTSAGLGLSRLLEARGRPQEAGRVLEEALTHLPDGESVPLRVRCEAELAGCARVVVTERPALLRHLDTLRQRSATDWPPLPAVLQAHDAFELLLAGRPAAEVAQAADAALRTGLLAPDRSALYVAAQALLVADGLRAGTAHLERAVDLARSRGLTVAVSLGRSMLALSARWRGDLSESQFQLDLGWEAANVEDHARPILAATAIELALDRGELEEARAGAARCDLGEGALATNFGLGLLAGRARLQQAAGDLLGALQSYLRLGELYVQGGAERLLDHSWRGAAADVLLELGDRSTAQRWAAENLELARSFGAARPLGRALRVSARANPTEAMALAEEAVHVLRSGPARLELAKAHADWGGFLLQHGDLVLGREHLRTGLKLAFDCGAGALVSALRRRLTAAGGRPPPLRTTGIGALTPAERRIARLAAENLTNREIARELYVSEKTVEGHLSKVFRKIGVGSRAEISTVIADE